MKKLHKIIKVHKYWWFLVLVIIQSGNFPVMSYFTGKLAASEIYSEEFYNIIIILSAICFASLGLLYINTYCSAYLGEKESKHHISRFLDELCKKNMLWMDKQTIGAISSSVMETKNLGATLNNTYPDLLRNIFSIVWFAVIVGLIHPYFTALLVGQGLLTVLAIYAIRKPLINTAMRKQQYEQTFFSSLTEFLYNWKTVKVFQYQDYVVNKLKKIQKESLKTTSKLGTLTSIGATLSTAVAFGGFIGSAFLGLYIASLQSIKYAELYPVWTATLNFGIMVRAVTQKYNELLTSSQGAKRVSSTLALGEGLDATTELNEVPQHWGIELKNLSFAIKNKTILHHLSLNIPERTMAAFVGSSGAGKSTLMCILLKLLQGYEGEFKVGDVDCCNVTASTYLANVSYVPQEFCIFNTTIEENIRIGNINASLEEIEEAAAKASLHDYIMQLPEGYKTIVGERGVQLSGGQRQRLAIARALAKKPRILILDEATSALDSATEADIQESINNIANQCTIIIVAHRLSTIKKANCIYVMQEGRLIEQGDYSSLLAMEGVFSNMVKAQELTSTKFINQRQRSTTM